MQAPEILIKYFPPPKILTPKRAGIAISPEAVRMVQFGGKKKSPVLLHSVEEKLAKGVILDGLVKDKAALKEILKKMHQVYGVRFARVSIPERKTYIVKAKITNDKNNSLRNLVEMNLEDYVPMNAAEAVFDYDVIRVIPPKCREVELQISAIHKDVVGEYLDAFEGTGVIPSSIEIEAQSVARSVVASGDGGSYMVIDFGSRRTAISMVKRGVVGFTTTIDMSGETLEKLFHDKFGISKSEIEELKKTFSCVSQGVNEEDDKMAVFMSFIADLRDEIGKRLEYWKKHEREEDEYDAGREIILTGSESGIHGFDQYLSGSLGVHVEIANVWQNIFDFEKYIPEIHKRDSLCYSAAIGLALVEGV